MSNDQLSNDFKSAAEEYAARLRAAKEARENPKANTKANADLFANAMQAKLDHNSTTINSLFGYNI